MKKESIKNVNWQIRKLLNYIADDDRYKRPLSTEEINIIHIVSGAISMALEIAYTDNQLLKIEYYSLFWWEKLFAILRQTNYHEYYYELLRDGLINILKAHNWNEKDIIDMIGQE